MRIILDTNFLIDCIRFRLDLKAELRGNELFVLDSIIFEIEKVIERGTKESKLATLALDFIKRKHLKILKPKEKNTDLALLDYSKKGYAIATQDKVLKNKIKKTGGKLIFIRQKRYVVFE